MEILYGAAEMAPFAKVGGLADVAGGLTRELVRLGHGVRVFLPLYPSVRRYFDSLSPEKVADLQVPLGRESIPATLHRAKITAAVLGTATAAASESVVSPEAAAASESVAGPEAAAASEGVVELLLLEQDQFFDRPNPYVDPDTGRDWPDNARRFAFLCHALPVSCAALQWTPDVIHLNDYQLGPVAVLLREGLAPDVLRNSGVVFSIHNLGYQGIFPLEEEEQRPAGSKQSTEQMLPAEPKQLGGPERSLEDLVEELGFPRRLAYPCGPLEFHGKLNFMKAGLVYADVITTVSPTYAREIQSEAQGFGLDGLLRERADRLVGILNGVDTQVWDPLTDPLIPYNYGRSDFQRKRENKARLLEVAHLGDDLAVPLIGMITRLVDQKGLDLFESVADAFLGYHDVRMVVLGSGMVRYEALMKHLEKRFPEKFAVRLGFDEPLAHLIEAGSDFFLMPSRYEPCGLNQMYSMRYGTVPIVHATGGLADTVKDYQPGTGTGRGFVFREYMPEALLGALERALKAYGKTRPFKSLVTRLMGLDFSWARAAREHEKVYERAIEERRKAAGCI